MKRESQSALACGAPTRISRRLGGPWYIAERLSPVALMVVSDARRRTSAALERVEEFRAAWG